MHQPNLISTIKARMPFTSLEQSNDFSLFNDAQKPFPAPLQQFAMEDKTKIKIIQNDNQAHLKIFIFHYLRMCLNKHEGKNPSQQLEKIEQMINRPQFIFFLPDKPKSLQDQDDASMKALLKQFMSYLHLGHQTIERSLCRYPLLLDIFIYFFRTLLYLGGLCWKYDDYISYPEIYNFLNDYFQTGIVQEDLCLFRFVQSGVCFYEEDPNQVYLIYRQEQKNQNLFVFMENSTVRIDFSKSGSSMNLNISKIEKEFQETDRTRKTTSTNNKMSQTFTEFQNLLHPETFNKTSKKFKPLTPRINLVETIETFYQPQSTLTESKPEWVYDFQDGLKWSVKNETKKYTKLEQQLESLKEEKQNLKKQWKKLEEKKKKMPWVNKNISEEFTNSLILKEINEPHRSNIQEKKKKARQARKALKFILK